MNKIYTLLIVVFSVTLGLAQCLDPVAETEQYFCTGSSITLDDLEVDPVSGTLTWFEDSALTNTLPGTTPVVDGETYYVINDCGANGVSNAVPITVYEQSVEFVVSPDSCINLGSNVFFIEEANIGSPVMIDVLNLDGDPFDAEIIWSPTARLGYYIEFQGNLIGPTYPFTGGTLGPGFPVNKVEIILSHYQSHIVNLNIPVGDGCGPSNESITIIAGGLQYNEFCFGDTKTLQDIEDYYNDILDGQNIQWYDEATGGTLLASSHQIIPGEKYYIDFGDPTCAVRIPVIVDYKVPAPFAASEYYFCSDDAWATLGKTVEETLGDIEICGANLKYYDSNFNHIANPNTHVLVDGETYYITNLVNGCESKPLKIEAHENDCGCMINTNFQNQDGTPDFRDIKIFQNPMSAYGNSFNVCNTQLLRNNQINLGAPESPPAGSDTYQTYASLVTPGPDPTLDDLGIYHPRTSPRGANCSAYSLRLNRNLRNKTQNSGIVYFEKEFVAGEVFAFDFSMVMENPTHHIGANAEPYFQVQVLGENGQLIESRCVKADTDDCILHEVGPYPLGHRENTLYTEWSCLKVNTIEAQGQKVTARIIASTCKPDFHFAYAYVDNLYVGDDHPGICDDSAYGYVALDPVEMHNDSENPYSTCSLVGRAVAESCSAAEPLVYPDFPIDIYGQFANPIGRDGPGTITGIELDIIRDNISVLPNPKPNNYGNATLLPPNRFRFNNIQPSDFLPNIPLYGHFTLEATINWETTCTGRTGQIIDNFSATALSQGFKICPVAECVDDLKFCVDASDLPYDVDLTVNEALAKSRYANPQEVKVSYYDDLDFAHQGINEITTPGAFSLNVGQHTIYLRLDYDWNYINVLPVDNCYDLVPFVVSVFTDPEVPTNPIELEQCEVEGQIDNIFDLEDMDLRDAILDQVLGNKADYMLEFYNTDTGATNQDATDLIPAPASVTLPVGGTSRVWVRIIAPAGCFSVYPIDLTVHEAPELLSSSITMVECEDTTNPGIGVFDLESEEANIVNPTLGHDVAYFEDAALTIPITSPNSHNGNDGDIIYVVVTDTNTDCTSVAEIVLSVVEAPVIPALVAIEACDLGNGEAEFDLDGLIPIVQDGDVTIEVEFYASLALAQAATPGTELPLLYTSGTATVHVRANYLGAADCPAFATLDLTVNPLPAIPTVPALELCADPSGTDVTFPLDSDTALITAILDGRPAADLDITFHDNQTDADSGSDPIIDITTGTSTSVWVRIEDITTSPSCHNTFELDLTVHPLPTLISHQDTLTVCEEINTPGVGVFDLENANIVDATLGYDVDYYADAGLTNSITTPGNHSGNHGDIVYVQVTDPNTDCSIIAQIELVVADAPPVPVLTPLEECDSGNGQASFDLAGLISYIQDGDPTIEVDFYASQAAADAATPGTELTSPYTSSTSIVFVRVNYQGADCPAVVGLNLVVTPLPYIPTLQPLAQCEDPSGGQLTFPLDSDNILIAAILDGRAPVDFDITFHDSFAHADAGTSTITEISTSTSTSVWVRIEDLVTDCHNTFELEIKINPLPTINSPVILQACDLGSGNGISEFDLNEATIFMVGLGSNYTVTYYESASDAEQATGAININYTNTIGYNDTVYARIEDNDTGCYIVEPIQLEVLNAPIAQDAELIYCDPNNDGEGIFYLPDADITSDPNATISYHRTQADADNDANPLPDTVTNNMINNQQYVYVRVEVTGVGCHTVVRIKLTIEETPELVTPSEIFIGCDEDGTGVHVFDLEEIVEEEVTILLNDPTDYDITYFETDSNGDKAAQIPSPSAYPSSGGIVIVMVTNPLTGCATEVEIELFVAPLPVVFNPLPLELCDVNNPGDEKELFYLDEATQEITGGDTSLTVTYHFSQADADAGINALEIPYENDVNNQTIFIRVENEFGCTVTTGITLTLVVNPLPAPVTPAPLEVCDIDNEGYAYFDLDSLENEIIANEPGVNLSFHETFTDAENATNPLTSPYQNIVADEQIVFARVFFADPPNGTGCFTIIEVTLKAIPSPVVPVELDDLYFCTPDEDSSVRVNLTVYEDLIYGNQNRDDLALTYHLSQQAAEAGTGAIADPTVYLLNPPTPVTIYVRLAYTNGVCYNIVPFTIHLVEGPQINDPTALSVCTALGEPNTETAVFDLLDKREEIIGQATGLGVYFYEDEADALIGNTNYITNPTNYTNIENPQLIYVRVVDSQENQDGVGCVAFTTLTLRVEPNPEPVTPEPIVQCHLDSDADFTIVDLTIRNLQILNHESWDLEFYEKYRHAVNGDQEQVIADPDVYELDLADSPKIIYVRVINPTSGCFEIVELEIILSTLPDVVLPEDIEPMIVCVTNGTERALFDLTSKIPEIFGNQDLTDLDVFFYEDLTEAIDGVNPIIDPDAYYNRENPQTIYVGIGNPDIDDCYIGGLTWFDIEVLKGAEAFSPEETYKVCGIPGPNGGVGIFDLSNEDLIDSILGTQDPNFFDVEFFLTEDDAHEGAVENRLGRTYENISNPQTIYVRVTNQDTGCYAIAEVVLEVIEIPGLILEDLYSFCTDAQGNPMEDADGNIIYPIIDTGLDASNNEITWYFEDERIIGQVGPSLVADKIGTYRVEIVNLDTGCSLSLDVEVVESSMPFSYGAEVTSPAFSGTYNIEAWADGFGDYTFSLNNGTPQDHGSFTNVGIGTHVITITDRNGCGSVDVVVNVVDYPKFFTPNDDGYNDTWNIPGMADLDPSAEIFIFDRHGKLLKQLNPQSEGWNGTFNGKPLPSTDYWFVVKYKEDGVAKEFKGHFSLKR